MNAPFVPPTKPWKEMSRPQKLAAVLPLAERNASFSQIAQHFGTTKGAVASIVKALRQSGSLRRPPRETVQISGRIHAKTRLNTSGAPAKATGHSLTPTNILNKVEGRKRDPGVPVTITAAAAFVPLDGFDPVRVVDIQPDHCRWPVEPDTDEDAHFFCGAPRVAGSPYCGSHKQLSLPAFQREDA